MAGDRHGHAVVVGGGVGGLVAARVLADHFDRVTVLEQDTLTADTGYRKGVPQARHTHALLARGGHVMEQLFPGLREELAAQGAPVFDLGESARFRFPSGWAPRTHIGVLVQNATRPALEGCLRRRVLALEPVSIRSGWRVQDLGWDPAHRRVTGVLAAPTSEAPGAGLRPVAADLVVHAAGRDSHLADWLHRAGYPAPASRTVRSSTTYASRLFKAPPGVMNGYHVVGGTPHAPDVRRAGGVQAVEGGMVIVTLLGAGGEVPPGDERGFLAYARSLPHPDIAEIITAGTPVGPVYRALRLDNRWVLYHRMPRWPERLLVLGDAVCSFNPVYGQGMTVAALEAELLGRLLRRADRVRDLAGIAPRFQRRLARALAVPWAVATSTDLGWAPGGSSPRARLTRWYGDQLIALIPDSPRVYRSVYQVAQMVRSPVALLHPAVLGSVARHAVRPRRRRGP
ncbi:FAD-dependent oxidoreductase [Kitasatospora sp. NPDC089509]|uniref:FAD-dependent oxidoreductase n=1 Tax=Kitasatospora sp. NPDC089509 TaxID=3364079 RepID=UPI00382239BB